MHTRHNPPIRSHGKHPYNKQTISKLPVPSKKKKKEKKTKYTDLFSEQLLESLSRLLARLVHNFFLLRHDLRLNLIDADFTESQKMTKKKKKKKTVGELENIALNWLDIEINVQEGRSVVLKRKRKPVCQQKIDWVEL